MARPAKRRDAPSSLSACPRSDAGGAFDRNVQDAARRGVGEGQELDVGAEIDVRELLKEFRPEPRGRGLWRGGEPDRRALANTTGDVQSCSRVGEERSPQVGETLRIVRVQD